MTHTSRRENQRLARQFVEKHFGQRACDLVPIGAGDWSQAYSLVVDGREMVIRFGQYREDFEKDQAMGRHSSDILPIPTVYEVGETETGYYALSQRVPGQLLDDLSPSEITIVLPQIFDAMAHLQTQDLTDLRDIGLWRPPTQGRQEAGTNSQGGQGRGKHQQTTDPAAGPTWGEELLAIAQPRDRLAGWRENLEQFPREAQAFDTGVARLRELAPNLPEYRGIVHNDLLNRNVLVDSGRLSGVIDWGNAFYGDPLYDIAWFLYWWQWYPQWQGVDLQGIIDHHWTKHGGPPPQMEERLRACLIHIGLDHVAYCAFRHRPDDMRRNAEQLLNYL